MINTVPYDPWFFQWLLDGVLEAVKWVWTLDVFTSILPFALVIGVVALLVFGFFSLAFRGFAIINEQTYSNKTDTADGFLGSKLSKSDYDRLRNNGKIPDKNTNSKIADNVHI